MSDAGISSIILVIATLIVATVVGGVFIQVSDSFSNSLRDSSDSISSKISADIQVVSGSQFVFEGNQTQNNTTIFVKNTGDETIQIETDGNGNFAGFDTFINGKFVQPDTVTVIEGDSSVWSPSDTARFRYENASEVQCFEDNEFTINVLGNEDTLVFYANC